MTDPHIPSTWVNYQSELCQSCLAQCCKLPVEVDNQDLLRLEVISPREAKRPLKQIARRLLDQGIIQSFADQTRSFILATGKEGSCIFLDKDKRCSVYEKRPQVCRDFPEIGPRPGFCPAKKK